MYLKTGSILTIDDCIALVCFGLCFVGYVYVIGHPPTGKTTLRGAMHVWRRRWMDSMTRRDVRMMDTQLIGHIMQSLTFFASSSILILAGLVAAFSAADNAATTLSALPFTLLMTADQFAIRLVLPTSFIVYAFFVFTTGLRQFNYTCVLIGALSSAPDSQERAQFIEQAATIMGLGTNNFNAGIRSYYFALASLSWFVHPYALVTSTLCVTLILYRRQMVSPTLQALMSFTEQDQTRSKIADQ